jgi:hypothetical protein
MPCRDSCVATSISSSPIVQLRVTVWYADAVVDAKRGHIDRRMLVRMLIQPILPLPPSSGAIAPTEWHSPQDRRSTAWSRCSSVVHLC